jgi:hypothetical protein
MAVRRAPLGIAWVQRMDPLGIVIPALADPLGRESRVGLGQIVYFVHEVTFTQVRIQIDNHFSSLANR